MNVRTFIAVVVTLVWAMGYIVSFLNNDFHAPVEVNAVMLLVAGGFFTSGIKKGNS